MARDLPNQSHTSDEISWIELDQGLVLTGWVEILGSAPGKAVLIPVFTNDDNRKPDFTVEGQALLDTSTQYDHLSFDDMKVKNETKKKRGRNGARSNKNRRQAGRR